MHNTPDTIPKVYNNYSVMSMIIIVMQMVKFPRLARISTHI